MNTRVIGSLLLVAGMLIGAFPAQAAQREQGGNDALRKAQYMLQKLSAEKTALEQENLRLAEELKKVQGELDGTRGKLDKTEQAYGQAQARNAALTDRVRADSQRISELQAAYRKEMGDARADIRLLHSAVKERDSWIADCSTKNEALYQANSELLAAYRDKDAWDVLKQREPLTGIASVQVENAVQEYQFRLEDLRTVKFEPDTALSQAVLPGAAATR